LLGNDGAVTITSALRGHPSLSVLDVSFNTVGDVGCSALASAIDAFALAEAIEHRCNLTCAQMTANKNGHEGVKSLARSIILNDARLEALKEAEHSRHITDEHTQRVSSIRELFLGGTHIKSAGFASVANMILLNRSFQVLNLSDNEMMDRYLALLSQSISRNISLPLGKIYLIFNMITCVGVESFANAVCGLKTLRKIRLDNNLIRDRGAQLAKVVLTSISLFVLDLEFNSISTAGIKALMKSIAENNTLTSLTISGNQLDTNASKAVSFALAYNQSLRSLYIDKCPVGYATQRHISAGIVSNSSIKLCVLTGF